MTSSQGLPGQVTFDNDRPIGEQLDKIDAMAAVGVSKWATIRDSLLQTGGSSLPRTEEAAKEELREMSRLLKKYQSLTMTQVGASIRNAARDKMQELSRYPQAYPRLFSYEIEEALRETTAEMLRKKEGEIALQLPANTGGNVFWGEPSEALAREWPNIVRNTKTLRATLNRDYLRDRFWYGGSKEQQAAAKQMLIQMVYDMTAAGFCTIDDLKKEAVGVFRSEFARAFPPHLDLVEHLACPLDFLQVEDIKKRLSRRIADVSEFPDIDDCKYSATFDLYFKFKNEK